MKQPVTPPNVLDIIKDLDKNRIRKILEEVPTPLARGRYEPWDKIRYLTPPGDLSPEEWWLGLKFARRQSMKEIPLRDTGGAPFRFATPDPVLRLVHEIDQRASGRIQVSEEVTNPNTRRRYVVASLIEEAITSSQLEGAATTSRVAKDMLRTGRRPLNRSERMIVNNYRAMQFIRQHVRDDLRPEMVFSLHRAVTRDTLDPKKSGRFRADADDIQIADEVGNVLHRPPPASELRGRMEAMCRFANADSGPNDSFLHPVIRAVILHFWMGYDHPFVDGNGRTARAIFYWAMLSRGYWLAEYISISRILRKAPGRYGRSFLRTEIDDNDLTYFISYQLEVVRRAIGELHQYLERKAAEVRRIEAVLRQSGRFNHRQLAILGNAVRHSGARYTIRSHQHSHGVAYDTARTDLLELAEAGLLDRREQGRTYVFISPADFEDRLSSV